MPRRPGRPPEPSPVEAAGSSSSATGRPGSTTTSDSRSTASSSRGPSRKGPTLDPAERRMAVHVEDHPIEYFDFEGVIPSKQYGAGDVIVWDWGTWEPEAETPDPAGRHRQGRAQVPAPRREAAAAGSRSSGPPAGRPARARSRTDESEQWLLIHKRDDDGGRRLGRRGPPGQRQDRPDERRGQGRSRRVLDQPGAGAEAEIDLSAAEPATARRRSSSRCSRRWPTGRSTIADWLFEIKWDGYRVQAIVADGKVRIYTRNGHDAATYFPRLLAPPARWLDRRGGDHRRRGRRARRGRTAGLLAAPGPDLAVDRRPRPGAVRSRRPEHPRVARPRRPPRTRTPPSAPLVYQVFDLLRHDGRSLLKVPLEERKRLLRAILSDSSSVRFAAHVVRRGDGVLSGRRRPGASRASSPSIAAPATSPAGGRLGLAQDQAAAGAGARRRRLDAGRGQRQGPRGASSSGSWTTAGCGSPARSAPASTRAPGASFASASTRCVRRSVPVRPATRAAAGPARASTGSSRSSSSGPSSGWTRDGLVRQSAFKGIDDGRDPRDGHPRVAGRELGRRGRGRARARGR